MGKKTYIDKNGYLRFNDSDKLVHRWVAYNQIYKSKSWKYLMKFKNYQVHHKDGNKLNNNSSNLQVVSVFKHKNIEGIKWGFSDWIIEMIKRLTVPKSNNIWVISLSLSVSDIHFLMRKLNAKSAVATSENISPLPKLRVEP